MTEVYPCFFVGDESDYEALVKDHEGWVVVHACKEPYHRRELGYSGRGAPRDHPEYLIAVRGDRLILNLVDAPSPDYIPKEIIDAALDFIHEGLGRGRRVLVHCNQGESRSPAIALLYLASCTGAVPSVSLEEAEVVFHQLYPSYGPKSGMRGFLKRHWDAYCKGEREADSSERDS